MSVLLWALALFLLLNAAALLWRVVTGPRATDRLLGSQAMSTQVIASLLLLSEATGDRASGDVAVLLAVFAVISTAAFVHRLLPWLERSGDPNA